jgi:hypothetical protein
MRDAHRDALAGPQAQQFSLDDYKSVAIQEVGAEIGAGCAVVVNLYNHYVRIQELHDGYFVVDDPGGRDRSNRKVLWDEARAMGYFRKRIVLK